MRNWHDGYTAETEYTYGYYTELNPLRTQLLLLSWGIQPPKVGTACELGFGQGMSVNIHAAAGTTRWYGTDFSPAQAAFAQELAQVSVNGAVLSDDSFQQFCARTDLPDLDFIALHGIWSWISPENQACIVDFLARKLKPGGVLYISYNTQAGWAAMAPIRDLMEQHSRVLSAPGQDLLSRVGSALSFVKGMLETKPRYLQVNPSIAVRMQQIGEMDANYVAHEFFNHYWQPASFTVIDP
ncbi:MAG: class I SAM-dependent methyltransferase, partial [Janthinobacterium sp.]